MQAFGDVDRRKAEAERLVLELKSNRARTDQEIVLLEASSEAKIRKTHRRYFESAQNLLKSAVREVAGPSRPRRVRCGFLNLADVLGQLL